MTPIRRRMLEDMQLRNFASETQRNYIHHIKGLAQFYQSSPEHLDLEDIRVYRLHLLNERHHSPVAVNQFVSAVKFLYHVTLETVWPDNAIPRVRVPHKLPVVLSPAEMDAFFQHVGTLRYRAALMTAYGAGLRFSEVVRFKIPHIDSERMLLRVEQGKGQKRSLRHVIAASVASDAGVVACLGQNLLHHPHLHCVVPGGGIAPGGERWISCRPGFFLPVRVLSRLFRRLFLEPLQAAFRKGRLRFFGDLAALHDPARFTAYLAPSKNIDWVVYAKPPFGGPCQVLDYPGRYTHRVALSNERLLNHKEGQVTFQWKDYRSQDQQKSRTMTLGTDAFIRRFLMHVLPRGFQRIRFFGWLTNRHRKVRLALCRRLLAGSMADLLPHAGPYRELPRTTEESVRCCPSCRKGEMIRVLTIAPGAPRPDSS